MSVIPQGLPDPFAILKPEVLHEVGLSDMGADRGEQVHEGLQQEEVRLPNELLFLFRDPP